MIRIKAQCGVYAYKRAYEPICPKCHITMSFFRGCYPRLLPVRTYDCEACGYVFTEVEGFADEERAMTLDLRADSEAMPLQ